MERAKASAVRDKLYRLEAKKNAAVASENYKEADKLKTEIAGLRREEQMLSRLESNESRIAELEELRDAAVAAEDFLRADEIKKELGILRKQTVSDEKSYKGQKEKVEEAERKKEKEGKEPTEEELKKNGPSGYKSGTFVEIFGLESGEGQKLNGQQGRVTHYIYEKIRYEVALSGGKKVSVRPMNLKELEKKLDAKWMYGNTCRLVCLRDAEDEALREANGCLGTLMSRSFQSSSWKVMSNGKMHSVPWECLRVCSEEEEGIKFGYKSQLFQSFVVVTTVHLILAFMIVSAKVEFPEVFSSDSDEEQADDSIIRLFLNPPIPSTYVAGLCAAVAGWSFLVLWGTIVTCCTMHRSLWDPQTTFPQIAELSVGQRRAKTVFRFGFGMVAAMVLASVVLHRELVIPHLPSNPQATEDIIFWGIVGVVGVGVQAGSLVEEVYSWHTLVHRLGHFMVVLAAYKYQNATMKLYLPGVHTTIETWLLMLREYLPDRELLEDKDKDWASTELIKNAQEFVSNSKFLGHSAVHTAVMIRYHILSYWPLCVLMLPVLSSICERVPENSKVSGSTLLRSMYAWLQWLLAIVLSLMQLSYVPDLMVASTMPVPVVSEDS
jgi:hypothetical protein